MGYIDADTHVLESESTWSYLSDQDARWRPKTFETDGAQAEWHGVTRFWYLQGQLAPQGLRGLDMPGTPPDEVRYLDDPAGRVAWMDRLGSEVQVLIPSFFLVMLFDKAEPQVALARSYNRWLADRCSGTGGRLRWCLVPPLLDRDACLDELRFGAANGAVSLLMRPLEIRRLLTDPYFYPLYEEAQKLGLTIGIHIGNADTPVYGQMQSVAYTAVNMAAAFISIVTSDFAERYPELRFGFLEGGSEWLPFAYREISRGISGGARRHVEIGETPMRGSNLYIDCTFDENLPEILKFAGEDNLVLGSDFGHTDFGTDVEAQKGLLARTDVEQSILKKITDDNGRRLYGLDRDAATKAA